MQRKTFKLFWDFTKPYKWRRAIALIGVVLSTVIESYLAPYILSLFINELQYGNITLHSSWPIITAYGATLLLSTVVTWRITIWATWSFEVKAQRDLAAAILEKLTSHSLNFHANRFGGSLISRSSKLIAAIERFWDTIIWDLAPIITGVLSATVILSFIYWPYAVFLFVLSLIFTIAVFVGSRFILALNKADVAAYTELTGFIADVVTNISNVKSFGAEQKENIDGYKNANQWHEKLLLSMRGFLKVSTVWSLMITALYVGSLIFAVIAAEQGNLSIGTVYLLLTYTLTVGRQLWNINGVIRSYNRLMGDSHDMVEILHTEPDIIDNSTVDLQSKRGAIAFNAVGFAHDLGEGTEVFDNFNLHINPGEKVGLVGHSGSGKTTLTRLLLRFSDIQTGAITIDGQNIANVTQESLRRSVSYVAQEPLLFHRSLAENIAYGRPDATAKEIERAANLAHATEFIKKLPEGFNTLVGERGVKLSGGQRQRIAIARAILKDAPILILDEATSALDSESEVLIQSALENLMKNKTSIVIAHRLSTIAKLDRIIVLDNGKISEDGTHQELLKKNGTYAKLWTHQSGGFIEE
jgi:ATP-binding cassette subfamily B protein